MPAIGAAASAGSWAVANPAARQCWADMSNSATAAASFASPTIPALWAKPVMGSWRRHHHGRAEIRRAYAPHYELAIAKRSAALSVENSLCRDATEQRSQRFGFFRWEYRKAAGHRCYGERNGRDAS